MRSAWRSRASGSSITELIDPSLAPLLGERMARAPFQVIVFLFVQQSAQERLYAIFRRSDHDSWRLLHVNASLGAATGLRFGSSNSG